MPARPWPREPLDLDDETLAPLIGVVEAEIHSAPNRVRYAMNGALIAMGASRPALAPALAAAARIGRVEVDHRETGCTTPDAAFSIRKTVTRRKLAGR